MASSIYKIANTTLTSATATVEFASIPSTYNDLIIKIAGRTTASTNNEYFNLRINNDSGAKYYKYTGYSNGDSWGTQVWANEVYMYVYQMVGDTATANTFSNHELYIPNYNTATNKAVLEDSCSLTDNTTSNSLRMVTSSSMLWRPTTPAAVTTLTFTAATGNFKIGSTFTLYGVKK